ncbi:MAG: glycosyltransferase family 2 protein [Candidatus Omnitrophica bacterium]|nr:glycosyltransferase family 2 protein [Candidatus Omnitrophota bacterium]
MNQHNPYLSVILPVYNEADNLNALHRSLCRELQAVGCSYEIIYCDDGSDDGSTGVLKELARSDPNVRILILRRNYGQTAAISAGVDHARGEIMILLDADLQNDPADIPRLLQKIDEGYDIVSGWRRRRSDPWISKKLPSRIANKFISWITGVPIHDQGCTLKAYRSEIMHDISLYGEMHRFISILGYWNGAKVAEVEVRHHPRQSGKSKYSLIRIFKVLLDIPLLVLLGNYITRPMHFFGIAGIGFHFAAVLCALRVAKDMWEGEQASENGFLILSVFFFLVGVMTFMMGLLAELTIRVYHESQQKKTYLIRESINPAPPRTDQNE